MPLEFYDSFGGRVRITPQEYFELLGQTGTQTYLGCVYAILVATDAPGMIGQMNLVATLAIWAVILSSFLLCHGVMLFLWATLYRALGNLTLPGALVTASALVLPVVLGETLLRFTSHGDLAFAIFPQILFYFVIAETFIMIYMRFVRPLPTPEAADATAAALQEAAVASPPHERHILIGAEPVALRNLRHIQAMEHHVRVVLDDTSLTHRARLSDIVAQTDPEDGIQPHRSWWVAKHVARSLERDGQKHVLTLDDGTRVPVARSRVHEVRDWMSERA